MSLLSRKGKRRLPEMNDRSSVPARSARNSAIMRGLLLTISEGLVK